MPSPKALCTKTLAIALSFSLLLPAGFAQALIARDAAYGAQDVSSATTASTTIATQDVAAAARATSSSVHGSIAPLNPEYVSYLESLTDQETIDQDLSAQDSSTQDITTQSAQTQSATLPSTLDLSYLSE